MRDLKKRLYKTSRKKDNKAVVYVRDRLKITHDITIQGWLTDTSSKTAFQIMEDLIDMFKKKGALDSFTWRGTTYTDEFTIEKMRFEDSPLATANVPYNQVNENEVRIRYTIGLVWGEPK